MNRREKLLLTVVASLVGIGVAVFVLRSVITKPLAEIDKRTAALREKIDKIKAERRAFFAAEEQVKALTLHTFADTIDKASAKSGEILTRQIVDSGLQETEFTRLPVGPRKLRGANEIGWSVQGEGPLSNVVNLVFTLQQSPWAHRVEGLVISSGDAPGQVKVHLRYLTLVLDPSPEVSRVDLPPKFTLDSPERRILDGVVLRDILRPYIKRPPPPPPPAVPGTSPGRSVNPLAPPGPEMYRIVSLTEWQGQPEIHVRDLVNQKTLRYKTGDALAGGTVEMVDYRPLPLPGSAGLLSYSRVILKIAGEHWAIDGGKTFADKRKLARNELPAELAATGGAAK